MIKNALFSPPATLLGGVPALPNTSWTKRPDAYLSTGALLPFKKQEADTERMRVNADRLAYRYGNRAKANPVPQSAVLPPKELG